jgi:regulator of replication initiation timing
MTIPSLSEQQGQLRQALVQMTQESEALSVQNAALNAQVAHQAGRIKDLEEARGGAQAELALQQAEIKWLRDAFAAIRSMIREL